MSKKTKPHGIKILIVGVDESERDTLVQMVVKGNKKIFPKLTVAKLPDFSEISSFKHLDERRKKFHKDFDVIAEKKGNIILTGNLSAHTKFGFVPLLTEKPISVFRPDLTILLEVDSHETVLLPEYGIIRKKRSTKDIQIQQQLNMQYATMLFSVVKILRVDSGDVKKSLRTLKEVLKAALR